MGHGIRFDGVPGAPTVPPPLLGEHTDEVLAELGFDADEIQALHEGGAV
jgi:crotonobetainyl-CoA:carnitine CoA-transferase CaiB-like acyl-CoA transferase